MRIASRMVGDFIENGREVALRSPVKLSRSLSVIYYQPWNIERARRGIRFDRMFSETLRTPPCKLRQRHGVTGAASDIERCDFMLRVF